MASPLEARNDAVVSLAKRRGFVFPSSEIYGGTRSAWDYGPLGVELKENIRRQWWRAMVQRRDDVVGLDSSVILPREVWVASGHVETFTDPLTECQNCHHRFRADHLEEAVRGQARAARRPGLAEINCPHCGTKGAFTEPRQFSGLLKTYLGPVESEEGLAYLRPETAQGIFVNFKNVMTSARKKPPFGIAQTGKSFRNEITPGNFIFRTREFEQMEMEFFVEPGTDERVARVLAQGALGLVRRPRPAPRTTCATTSTPQEKLSHYSTRTVDIEYRFGFGGIEFAELEGIANRTDFDLTHALRALGHRPELPGPGDRRALDAVRHRARGRPHPGDAGLPARRVRRGRGAQHQGRRRQAGRAAVRPAAGAGQGRGAAAVPARRPVAGGQGAGRRAAGELERRLRRRRCDRPPLPPPGRDRYAVLRHRRLRHARGPRGDRARAGLDGAGAGRRWTRCAAYLAERLPGC